MARNPPTNTKSIGSTFSCIFEDNRQVRSIRACSPSRLPVLQAALARGKSLCWGCRGCWEFCRNPQAPAAHAAIAQLECLRRAAVVLVARRGAVGAAPVASARVSTACLCCAGRLEGCCSSSSCRDWSSVYNVLLLCWP